MENQNLNKKRFSLKGMHFPVGKNVFRFTISPEKQFPRLVIFSLVLLLISIAAHFFLFRKILAQDVFTGSGVASPVQSVNEKKLELVLKQFEDREVLRAKIVAEPPVVVDPGK